MQLVRDGEDPAPHNTPPVPPKLPVAEFSEIVQSVSAGAEDSHCTPAPPKSPLLEFPVIEQFTSVGELPKHDHPTTGVRRVLRDRAVGQRW